MTIWAATGHRPLRLGGYSLGVNSNLLKLATYFIELHKPRKVITGMALGWDQEIAFAAIRHGIPVIAAIPFKGQESVWPQHSKDRYHAILNKCHTVEVISEGGYSPSKMYERNEWMVDNALNLVALWDGSNSGGTAKCVAYSRMIDVPVLNLWPHWLKLVKGDPAWTIT